MNKIWALKISVYDAYWELLHEHSTYYSSKDKAHMMLKAKFPDATIRASTDNIEFYYAGINKSISFKISVAAQIVDDPDNASEIDHSLMGFIEQ